MHTAVRGPDRKGISGLYEISMPGRSRGQKKFKDAYELAKAPTRAG